LGLIPDLRCGKPSELWHGLRLVAAMIVLRGPRATRLLLLCSPGSKPCNAIR
jgi:hypothetical protein